MFQTMLSMKRNLIILLGHHNYDHNHVSNKNMEISVLFTFFHEEKIILLGHLFRLDQVDDLV